MSFAADTAVTAASTASNTSKAGGPTRYEGQIHEGWDIVGNTNGGVTMSMLARAALAHSGRPDVISVSTHFLAPGTPGPVTVDVEPIKDGRRFATSRVDLANADRTMLSGTIITGNLDDGEGPELITASAPEIAPPDQCIRSVSNDLFPPPFVDRIDQRVDPTTAWGTKPGPFVRGWMRLLDDEPLDTVALVLASDSMAPTVFNTHLRPSWVPTVQMTIHIRNRPTTEWLLLDSHTRFVTGGMFEVDNTIFDQQGTILAHSRQLQLLGLAH